MQEAVTWSFTAAPTAELFGGGDERAGAGQPDRRRPRLHAALGPAEPDRGGRPQRRAAASPTCALFEIGPVFAGDRAAATSARPSPPSSPRTRPRRWDGGAAEDLFALKADLMALLDELGAPTASLQVAQGAAVALVAPGPLGAAAAGPQGGAGRVRRAAPARAEGAGRRRPGLRLRDLARGHPRAEEEGGQDQAGAGALAADAADAATSPSWSARTRRPATWSARCRAPTRR